MNTQTYLTSKMNELPTNCIFDKGKVGCGGTTLAINSAKPYVIAVPYISLCENKVKQTENLFWFKSDTLKKELTVYLETVETPKIICVYDAIQKLSKWINTKEYSILIDELHIMCKDYSFRNDAVKKILKNYIDYKEYTFMTATVVEPEFLLDELVDIPVKAVEWDDVREVNVNSVRCINNVSKTTVELINSFLNGENYGNAYLFVNSVEFIKEMVELCNLTEDNCRVIFSKSNKTDVGITNGTTLDAPKKINLLTSTVFEGSDIYDENGRIIIISDNRKQHTLLDISTTIQQIAGRIRDTKYWAEITHLYSNSRYIDISYDEFKDVCLQQIKIAKEIIIEYNNLSDTAREWITGLENVYVSRENNVFSFDANMVKLDMMNFKLAHSIYKCRVNMNAEYVRCGFKVNNFEHESNLIITRGDIDKANFFDILEEVEMEQSKELSFKYVSEKAFEKYSWLKSAIEVLGFERMKEIGNITRIKEALIIGSELKNNIVKTVELLKSNISIGDFIPAKEAKQIMGEIYSKLEINKTAKGTDLNNYYELKETTKYVNNVKTRGYVIIKSKIIIK